VSVEDIITQNKCDFVGTNKLLTDDKRMRKAVWRWLCFVTEVDTPLRTITQKADELILVFGGCDDQKVVSG